MRVGTLALAVMLLTGGPEPPVVSSVEPPNWWTGHSINPVRLLVRGRGLHGAQVAPAATDVRVGLTRVNDRGTALFVDVHTTSDTKAGDKPLRIVTQSGTTEVPFRIDTPLAPAGRFQGFCEDDVIYLIMPDRFANGDPANDRPPRAAPELLDRNRGRYYHGGDLRGIIDRLPYLRDLAVTVVWLNPVYDNNDRLNTKERYDNQPITDYHGFGAIDFYGVDEHLGDLASLRELVEKAHALEMRVIQDQVANHTGPFHPWVQDPPTPTWFNGTESDHLANTFQTHLLMDPNTPEVLKRPTLDGWFIDILPDLNQADEEVSRYLIQNSLWWVGATGLDGIRQDTVPYVPRWFWQRWMAALKREYPRVRVVGEVLDGSAPFVSFFQAGRPQWDGIDTGIDTLFDYPVFFPLRRAFAQNQSIREVANALHQDGVYPRAELLVTLLGSHDVPRFMHEPGATIEGLLLAATFLLTTRGIPQWYYGDEIAMRGGPDPDNRRDFPGGWVGDPRNAFAPEGRLAEEQRVFEHVRTLMRLRASLEPLRRGRLTHLAIGDQTYVYSRSSAAGVVIVALNNGGTPAALSVDVTPIGPLDGVELVDRIGPAGSAAVKRGRIEVTLGPRSARVLAHAAPR